MRRLRFVIEAGFAALSSLAIQAVAIIVLAPEEYGAFALVYVVYAMYVTLGLALVSEPWARTLTVDRAHAATWGEYSGVSAVLALSSVLPVVLLVAWWQPIPVVLMFALATALAAYRSLARYFAAANREGLRVIPADIANFLLTVLGTLMALTLVDPLTAVAIGWLFGSAVSVALSLLPRPPKLSAIRLWFRVHRADIRVLLFDSMLLEIGNVGVPLAVAPVLGASQFGLYRAFTSLAVPVRLLLVPIRPLISRWTHQRHLGHTTIAAVIGVGFLAGALTYIALSFVANLEVLGESSLRAAAELFTLPVSLFVGITLISSYYAFVSRVYMSARWIVVLRIVQVLISIGAQVAGLMIGGLVGAVWGIVFASAVQLCLTVGANLLQRGRT